MSWKKHVQVVNRNTRLQSVLDRSRTDMQVPGGGVNSKFSSFLPEIYAGHPQRIQRYDQYDQMDQDSEVNAALDTIADFSTQIDDKTDSCLTVFYKKEANTTETEIIKQSLEQWSNLNQFKKRMWRLFRNAIKYGDQIFIRDPQTLELFHVEPANVEKVIANEAEGKDPQVYLIRDLDVNLQRLTITEPEKYGVNIQGTGTNTLNRYSNKQAGQQAGMGMGYTGYGSGSMGGTGNDIFAVDAAHVVHFSLSEGLDANWPFGTSILEPIFKVFKQKELLEDAIIIYRIHRAPERRVFYIDVGTMPPHRANAYIERIKNEIHQRRIPNRTGGGTSIMDATYNPLSVLEDYFFAQCESLDTLIPLLDGRTITLENIITEYSEGKVNYTYSMDPKTQKMEPGKIIWAGVTRKNAQVLKITFDNGKSLTTTPDHLYIKRDGTEIQAQDLQINDSLMPLYLLDGTSGPNQTHKNYTRYISNATGKKEWVHTTICPKKPGKETVVHHIDFNSKNNNPENLIEMNVDEHKELHKKIGTYSLSTQWNDPIKRQKLLDGMHGLYENQTEEFKTKMSKRNTNNGKKSWDKEESRNKIISALKETQRKEAESKKYQYSNEMFERVVQLFNAGQNSLSKMIKILPEDNIFQEEFKKANIKTKRAKNISEIFKPRDGELNKIVQLAGYERWGDFTRIYKKNHKVVSIEWLEERVDTGDITIETASGSHIFAVDAGIFIHNSSDSRGSKVDTLAGGESIAQIDDLKYFDNKLKRGLRVPSSYLPSGPDDGVQPWNDGRVGTAYIQEFRFGCYCERLQTLLAEVLDREFKMYMKRRGILIDNSLFDLKLNKPENFAMFAEIERKNAQVGLFSQIAEAKFLSKRFAMEEYLGLTQEKINRNFVLWREENMKLIKAKSPAAGEQQGGLGGGGGAPGLDSVGVRPDEGGDAGGMEGMAEPGAEPQGGGAGGLSDAGDAGAASGVAGGASGFGGPGGT